MALQQLCIRIGARSGASEPKYEGIEINMLPDSPFPVSLSFTEGSRFDANTVGLCLGVMWGTLLVLLGLMATMTGLGSSLVEQLGLYHIGYEATVYGSIIGGVVGLIYGFVFGAIIFRAYNMVFARD